MKSRPMVISLINAMTWICSNEFFFCPQKKRRKENFVDIDSIFASRDIFFSEGTPTKSFKFFREEFLVCPIKMVFDVVFEFS